MARVTHPPKAYVSWSSGKDSAFALYEARRLGLAEIVGVLTTMNEVHQRVAMHAVRDALLDRLRKSKARSRDAWQEGIDPKTPTQFIPLVPIDSELTPA
jgi:hypothetical protein